MLLQLLTHFMHIYMHI